MDFSEELSRATGIETTTDVIKGNIMDLEKNMVH